MLIGSQVGGLFSACQLGVGFIAMMPLLSCLVVRTLMSDWPIASGEQVQMKYWFFSHKLNKKYRAFLCLSTVMYRGARSLQLLGSCQPAWIVMSCANWLVPFCQTPQKSQLFQKKLPWSWKPGNQSLKTRIDTRRPGLSTRSAFHSHPPVE